MNRAHTRSYAFDDRAIRWYKLGDFEHFVFAMLDVDVSHKIVDFLVKYEPNQQIFPHSIEFSGEGPLPFVISLKLCRYSSMLGHQLHRPSNLRMTHAKHGPPDPRKPDHHC